MFRPLATSTPKKEDKFFTPPNMPKKKAAPLSSKEGALEEISPFPKLDTEEEKETVWLREKKLLRRADEEREHYELCDIRSKFLAFVPAEISMMESGEYLRHLHHHYYPTTQSRNADEEAYLSIMRETILERMISLNISPVL